VTARSSSCSPTKRASSHPANTDPYTLSLRREVGRRPRQNRPAALMRQSATALCHASGPLPSGSDASSLRKGDDHLFCCAGCRRKCQSILNTIEWHGVADDLPVAFPEIGRASCRERG